MERIEQIFASMGFDVADGPEIERLAQLHLAQQPAEPPRAFDAGHVLRGHRRRRRHPLQPAAAHQPDAGALPTSTSSATPMRSSAATHAGDPRDRPGRTYRVDSDATHSPMFHQCEGLWLGENVSFKDLKVVFTDFCRTFFESDDLGAALPSRASSPSPNRPPRSTSSSRAARWPAAGWRWPAPARCTRRWCATWGWTPSGTSASPSAWGRTA